MKRIYILINLLLISFTPLLSQPTSWMFGYHLSQVQADFGQGVQIATPSFLMDAVQLKLSANQRYLDYDLEGRNLWSDFYTFSAGLGNSPTMISERIGLYGEGGVMMILPNNKFSTSDQNWGGYGLFGFNFYFYPGFSYFIEAGGIGSGARADRSDNQRIYANGFFMNVGFKLHL